MISTPSLLAYIFHLTSLPAYFTIFHCHIDTGIQGCLSSRRKIWRQNPPCKIWQRQSLNICQKWVNRETRGSEYGLMLKQMFSVMPLDNPLTPWKTRSLLLFLWVYLIYLSWHLFKMPEPWGHYRKAYSFIKIEPQTTQHSGACLKELQSNLLNKTKWWYGNSYYKRLQLGWYCSKRWKLRLRPIN